MISYSGVDFGLEYTAAFDLPEVRGTMSPSRCGPMRSHRSNIFHVKLPLSKLIYFGHCQCSHTHRISLTLPCSSYQALFLSTVSAQDSSDSGRHRVIVLCSEEGTLLLYPYTRITSMPSKDKYGVSLVWRFLNLHLLIIHCANRKKDAKHGFRKSLFIRRASTAHTFVRHDTL